MREIILIKEMMMIQTLYLNDSLGYSYLDFDRKNSIFKVFKNFLKQTFFVPSYLYPPPIPGLSVFQLFVMLRK